MIRIKLSARMGELRCTQAALARKTGIRPATICELYNEMTSRVNLEQLDKICEVLDCDLGDILVRVHLIKMKGESIKIELLQARYYHLCQ